MSSPIRHKQQRVRMAILVTGGLVLLAFLGADPVLRGLRRRDQIGAVHHEGVATVVTLVLPRPNENGDPLPPLATVRFQGRIYSVNQVYEPSRLQVDAPAHIDYRVGRSGAVYVDAVEPLALTSTPPAKDPQH